MGKFVGSRQSDKSGGTYFVPPPASMPLNEAMYRNHGDNCIHP
jgi:hypothetical protein